jgi:hypothetical protein
LIPPPPPPPPHPPPSAHVYDQRIRARATCLAQNASCELSAPTRSVVRQVSAAKASPKAIHDPSPIALIEPPWHRLSSSTAAAGTVNGNRKKSGSTPAKPGSGLRGRSDRPLPSCRKYTPISPQLPGLVERPILGSSWANIPLWPLPIPYGHCPAKMTLPTVLGGRRSRLDVMTNGALVFAIGSGHSPGTIPA